jgi:hypothetical protein
MKLTTIPTQQASGMEFTSTGVIFNHSVRPDYETLKAAIGQFGRMVRGAQFCLGDLINYAEHEHGSKYDEWLELTGMSYQTLRDIASVARNIPLSSRNDNLDFTHHKIIAAKVKTEDNRRKWINIASARGLSSRELKESIKRGKMTTNADLEREKELAAKNHDERGTEPHSVTLLKLTRWTEDAEAKHGTIDAWPAEVREQLRLEFQPIQKFMERLYQ